jgi:hypothetical protein
MRRVLPSLAGAIVLSLAAACGSSSTGAAHAPRSTTPPTTTTTPAAHTASVDAIRLRSEPGVTPAELQRADKLIEDTLKNIGRYRTPAMAYAAGYRSIGDAVTGDEHYVNWSYANDGHILDPQRPESVVYEVVNGQQQAVAFMYGMPFGSTFADVPDVGGALTQWHVHANLCLTDNPQQRVVAGLTTIKGSCPPGTSKAGNTPMLHVWAIPNPCGPFAALEGVGAGQVPKGQTRNCDTLNASVR